MMSEVKNPEKAIKSNTAKEIYLRIRSLTSTDEKSIESAETARNYLTRLDIHFYKWAYSFHFSN